MDSTAESKSAKQELADLQGVLEDMYEKVEELQQVLKDHLSTKNALKVTASVCLWSRVVLLIAMSLCTAGRRCIATKLLLVCCSLYLPMLLWHPSRYHTIQLFPPETRLASDLL